MLIKSEIPWHIVLIVFVAFVSWVWNKIQEVAAERKRRRFQKVKRSYDQQERQQRKQQPSQQIPQPTKAVPEPGSKSPLQQMMDAMTGNVEEIRRQQELVEAQRKAKLRAQQQRRAAADNSPPPLPQKQRERNIAQQPAPIRQKPSLSPTSDLRPIKTPLVPLKSSALRRKKRRSGVRSLLRGKDSLRQALIASEILQKPRGMDE